MVTHKVCLYRKRVDFAFLISSVVSLVEAFLPKILNSCCHLFHFSKINAICLKGMHLSPYVFIGYFFLLETCFPVSVSDEKTFTHNFLENMFRVHV
ncbi:hypothetical protein EB796_013550 [Bugula neritina]|uniref:Uncharacterized protein n=1 Tax=Bugula neritina TaxID=10212 RepID=A0A7J7JP88_BUGNE|nr:hypothetical protein EB796_013550 [Bugula neritina]